MSGDANRQAQKDWVIDPSLFDKGDKILVGVSGGADSMVLLDQLVKLGAQKKLEIAVLHINYGMRGEESDEDEHLVQTRCRELEVFLTIHRSDDLSISDSNLEEAARTIRHKVLKETAKEVNASVIALGHTLDDQAETILMHLIRGAGLKGLGGMSKRDGLLVRPLLDVSRESVRTYAHKNNIIYRDDSSNWDMRFTRNKVRQLLMPMLTENFNPNIRESLANAAEIYKSDEAFLQELTSTIYRRYVKEKKGAVAINASELLEMPPALQRRLVRTMIKVVSPKLSNIGHRKALMIALDTLNKSDAGMKLDLGEGLTLERKAGILTLTLFATDLGKPDTLGKSTISKDIE